MNAITMLAAATRFVKTSLEAITAHATPAISYLMQHSVVMLTNAPWERTIVTIWRLAQIQQAASTALVTQDSKGVAHSAKVTA